MILPRRVRTDSRRSDGRRLLCATSNKRARKTRPGGGRETNRRRGGCECRDAIDPLRIRREISPSRGRETAPTTPDVRTDLSAAARRYRARVNAVFFFPQIIYSYDNNDTVPIEIQQNKIKHIQVILITVHYNTVILVRSRFLRECRDSHTRIHRVVVNRLSKRWVMLSYRRDAQ